MLPSPGCVEILPARSRVSDERVVDVDVPGAGRVVGEESIGRRRLSMEKDRGVEGRESLGLC